MTRPLEDVRRVAELAALGLPHAEISRLTSVPRSTIRGWAREGFDRREARTRRRCEDGCSAIAEAPPTAYAYLLGLYLGDGCISTHARGVFRLRIVLDQRYPGIIAECEDAMATVLPNVVNQVQRPGCIEVSSYSRHWPCLFPQHGPGLKHRRQIVLADWQRRIALDRHPELFLRGLIHSDGCRVLNWVRGTAYPRYQFTNHSDDIQQIFLEACARVGVACRPNNRWNLSIARRESVAILDRFVGPKR
jgi:hypothetical protein